MCVCCHKTNAQTFISYRAIHTDGNDKGTNERISRDAIPVPILSSAAGNQLYQYESTIRRLLARAMAQQRLAQQRRKALGPGGRWGSRSFPAYSGSVKRVARWRQALLLLCGCAGAIVAGGFGAKCKCKEDAKHLMSTLGELCEASLGAKAKQYAGASLGRGFAPKPPSWRAAPPPSGAAQGGCKRARAA
mgnify:CR=1 FL=1